MSSQNRLRCYETNQPGWEAQPPIQDNWETSFDRALHTAVDTLFTYRPIAERLAETNQNEAMQALVRERKLSLVERLGDIAQEEVRDVALCLGRIQAREPVSPPILQSVEAGDPYDIAWNLVEAWKGALQQLGQMSRPSDLTEQEEFDDYHDKLNRLYRRVCYDLGLLWPPPLRDMVDDWPSSLK